MSTVWIAALVLLLAPAGLAFADGGDDAEVTAAGAGVTLAALALLALFSPAPLLRGRPAVVALGALVGLAVLTAASLSWTRVSAPAGDDLLRLVFYASAFAVALIVLRHPGPRQAAVPVLLATCVAVALYALAARLAPSSLSIGLDFRAGPRVHQPIPYWNAMGIHTAFGILLALAVASDPRRSPRAQALACACVPGFGLVLYLTFSRGALLALAAGLAALLLLRPARATVIAAALSLAAAAVAVAGSRLVPAVVDLEAGAPAPSAAGAVLVGTLVAATGAGAALGFRRLRRTRWSEGEIRLRRPLRLAAGLAVLGAVVVLGGIFAARPDPAQDVADDEARLATVQTNRARYWGVALDAFAAHPVVGVGSGSFTVEWRRERTVPEGARDAHSLYLETLAELGVLGGVLLAALLAAVAVGFRRRLSGAPRDPVLVPAGLLLTAYAVHAGLDWDWEVPAVTLPVLICAALVLQPPSTETTE